MWTKSLLFLCKYWYIWPFSVNSAPTVFTCWYESNGIFLYICVRFVSVCDFAHSLWHALHCQSHLNCTCRKSPQKKTRWRLADWLRFDRLVFTGSHVSSKMCFGLPCNGRLQEGFQKRNVVALHCRLVLTLYLWLTSGSVMVTVYRVTSPM